MKLRTNFTTPVSFWEQVAAYTDGQGYNLSWTQYAEGAMTVFPCEWRTNFRVRDDEIFRGESQGNQDYAKIRMPYIPCLYEKLRSSTFAIVKGADSKAISNGEPDPGNPNVYQLWGGVENIHEENRYMEFSVRRFEVT